MISNVSNKKRHYQAKQFCAHKAVLCKRSPVFAAMFTTEMREASENVVKITDIAPVVFEQMLQFMYTGKLEKLKKYAGDLYKAADKVWKGGNHWSKNLGSQGRFR